MSLKKSSTFLFNLLLIFCFSLSSFAQLPFENGPRAWHYNPGPDPRTEMGRAVLDIYANLPDFEELSEAVSDDQFFRPVYGMMLARTRYETNAVKILFIGQDATHVAEASKQPGTSGFGGRVQSIGNFFGVDHSISTTNAYLSTIRKQYGAFNHVYVETNADGEAQIKQSSYVDNELWILSNDERSELVIQRELFWEWMIKNNPDSLSLLVTFGGAARDAFAEFLIRRGFEVPTRMNPDRLKNIQVPETRLVSAGGNNTFAVPVNAEGRDIYAILLEEEEPDYSSEEVQEAAVQALKDAGKRGIEMMVFTGGGESGSGVLHAAQLGGYDLSRTTFKGKKTVSLRGLKLSDGTVVKRDIGFATSPHPTALSQMEDSRASQVLREAFKPLESLKQNGWRIEPDFDDNGKKMTNLWHNGESYKYGRADIGPWYFAFGDPDDRRVARADASRLDTQVIVVGTRDRPRFDTEKIKKMKNNKPSEAKNENDLWTVRPRQKSSRYDFDLGPGIDVAELLLKSIDREKLFEPKAGMKKVDARGRDITFETNGIDAYNTKTHPGTGLFGFHRGSFDKARALILADPHGIDDWITGRALTGARGQHLNGLMSDLGFADDYLVIKTVPVGMDGATAEEWEAVRSRTEKYREVAIATALKKSPVEVIFADGEIAAKEMARLLKKLQIKVSVINIERTSQDPEAGILEAGKVATQKVSELRGRRISGERKDIARSHLPWWSRTWEGTGGDSVIDASGKHRGGVRAVVAPNWVARQDPPHTPAMIQSIEKMQQFMEDQGVRADTEELSAFLKRKKLGKGNFFEIEESRTDGN